jgi:hypothetical protein
MLGAIKNRRAFAAAVRFAAKSKATTDDLKPFVAEIKRVGVGVRQVDYNENYQQDWANALTTPLPTPGISRYGVVSPGGCLA